MPYNLLSSASAGTIDVGTIGAPVVSGVGNLSDMSSELAAMLGERSDVTVDRLVRWINWGYINLCRSVKLPELLGTGIITTVDDQYQYLIPSVVASTLGASITTDSWDGGRPLDKIEILGYRARPDRSGVPNSFFRHGNLIVLHPTPNKELTVFVDFRVRPLPLGEEDHAPIIGAEWSEAIVLNARRKALGALLEFDKAALANNDYVDVVRGLRDTAVDEDEGRIVLSSVPRSRRQLRRKMRGRDYDALG
jgi:hypothetical protein